ncbi:hypothetical protein BU107_04645 [Staphylococcus xylosus]|uniref:hypothetical protein n=1 Tax=Staphylococcus TaxID=1279 RepID=UPI000E6828B7|nr:MULTISPECIES: hypothetical protein [Staphylococcus]MCE5003474.1 hypothetical protein [Staphylococcus pseudoxylosus]RIM88895.1 hypothetical protein BU107_04645 [Staphylococcus xylosus]
MDTFNSILDWFKNNLQTTGQKGVGVVTLIAVIGLVAWGIILILKGESKKGVMKFIWAVIAAIVGSLGLRFFANIGEDSSEDFKNGLGNLSYLAILPTYAIYKLSNRKKQ